MRMAKATDKDLDCAFIVIGMIDDIEREQWPSDAFGDHADGEPDYFDCNDADHCKAFVTNLLALVGKREHAGSLNRVVFGMSTVMSNETFDPAVDHLSWHPDLLPAIHERQRRRAIDKAAAGNPPLIDWKRRDALPFSHDFSGYAARLYHSKPDQGWVMCYKEGGEDITFPLMPPEPGMEPERLVKTGQEQAAWYWVQFGKEAS